MEILHGYHSVNEAFRAGRRTIREIWLSRGKVAPRVEDLAKKAADRGVNITRTPESRLSTMAGTGRHQGLCVNATRFPYIGLGEILDRVKEAHSPRLLLLDSILDPHNLGALIRTAYCAGMDGVVIPRDRSAAATPVVSRISAGALEHTHLTRVTNLVTAIAKLKKAGFWVAGLDRAGQDTLFSTDLSGRLAVVLGSEENGLRPLVKKYCDMLIAIPQKGVVDSLNASVAGGVVMYEMFRQRLSR